MENLNAWLKKCKWGESQDEVLGEAFLDHRSHQVAMGQAKSEDLPENMPDI